MTNTTNIANEINTFDHFYLMSDDNSKYNAGNAKKDSIYEALNEMTMEQLAEVKSLLTVRPETLSRHFSDFEKVEAPKPKKKNEVRSKVMSNAWTIYKTGKFTFGESMSIAWKRHKLLAALKSGIVYFAYNKTDNSRREAIGTLREGNYNYDHKGSDKPSPLYVVKYYDIEKQGFRSVRLDRLQSIAA